MKLLNKELVDKIYSNVYDKVLEHALFHSPVRDQIKKNFGLWDDDGLFMLKIHNPNLNIRRNLDGIN